MATYAGKLNVGGSDLPIGSTLYGTCGTGASTAAKVVTCANFDKLLTGVTIHVKFTYSNTASSPTLNVNSTGAKTIYRYGTTAPSTTEDTSWKAGAVVSFTYDGTYWIMNDWQANDNTTYGLSISDHTVSLVSGGSTSSVTIPDNNTTYGLSISDHTVSLVEGGSTSSVTVPDNNTTYTFANGTNGFTVTPSGGSAQTITVTPSITNNITGSGTSGHIAKYDGANSITDGPAFGSDTAKYLRNDGNWAAITSVTGYDIINGDLHTWAMGLDIGFYPFITAPYLTTGTPDDESTNYTQAYGYALIRYSSDPSSASPRELVLYARTGDVWYDFYNTVGGANVWNGWFQNVDSRILTSSIRNNYTTTNSGYILDARIGSDLYSRTLMAKGSVVGFSTNLNSITAPGVYHIPGSASATNMPTGVTYGTLLVIRGDTSSSFFNQVLYVPTDGTVSIYTRSTVDSGSTWRSWAQVADNSAFDSYLKTANVANNQTTTASGYALDARQANASVSNSLGAKIATNASDISTLSTALGTLAFEHVIKSAVTAGYNSTNIVSFKSKIMNVTNYNGHAFFVILNSPQNDGGEQLGVSLYMITFSNAGSVTYSCTRIGGAGYQGTSSYYPKFGATSAGNLYVLWNSLPTGVSSINIHCNIFEVY